MSVQELKAQARKHWEKWLPEKVKALKEAGRLNEEMQAAATRAQTEIEHLMGQGYSIHEAKEVALPKFILLPPENPDQDLPDDEAEELAKMEREYQKNPAPESRM